MDRFLPLLPHTMSPSEGATAKPSSTCGCTAASDNGVIVHASNGGSVQNSHSATHTISNGTSNHSATQTNGHISGMVSRFHSGAPAAIEPIADNGHVSSTGMHGLWTKPVTAESLATELEEEKRKCREAEQMVCRLWEELSKMQMALSDQKKSDSATQEDA